MKRLILMRHAKAIAQHKHLSDLERSLTPRGEKDAKRAAREIKSHGTEIDILISSPANRALETAHLVARELDYPVQKIALKQAAYDARDAEGLYPILRDIEDHLATAILIGHNPSMEELAASLVPEFADSIRTSGMVEIRLDKESWRDVLPGDGVIQPSESEAKTSHPEPNKKEMRRILSEKIAAGLSVVVNDIHADAAHLIDSEINKAADKLARTLIKFNVSE